MDEFRIIEELKQLIHQLVPVERLKFEFGQGQAPVNSNFADAIINVNFENIYFKLIVEVSVHDSLPILIKKISRLKSFCVKNNMVPVVLARYLSIERQEVCKREGVCFIDLSGNVYLKFKSFYIERVGFHNKFPEKRSGRNPFSDKASLILRVMLDDVEHHWGIREMADKTGLNPGYVSRMAEELVKRKYIARAKSKLRIRSPEGILDDWTSVYNIRKNKTFRYFCMTTSASDIIDNLSKIQIPNEIEYSLSVQAGASIVSPYSVFKEVHVYVDSQKEIEYFKKHLNLNSADQGANFIIMLPYYKNSVFFGKQNVNNLCVVSDLQLYLDLYEYPIRGREQAEHLFDKRLRNLLTKEDNL